MTYLGRKLPVRFGAHDPKKRTLPRCRVVAEDQEPGVCAPGSRSGRV